MRRLLFLVGFASLLVAAAPRPPNLLRDAFSPVVPLVAEKEAVLTGETDGDHRVTAKLKLDKDAGLDALDIVEESRPLAFHPTALHGLKGANRAWLEERGQLTTLVVEGTESGKDWRLALEFHSKQLWLRRVSREGQRKDAFTYYDRDDLEPQKTEYRKAHVKSFRRLSR